MALLNGARPHVADPFTFWAFNVVVVKGEFRMKLVCFSLQETVESVKATLSWPMTKRARSRSFLHWG